MEKENASKPKTAFQFKKHYVPQLKPYQWKKGQSGNPKGKTPGKSLKTWVREYLLTLSEEDKIKFMKHIDPEMAWKMAEGLPHQTTDVTSGGNPIPIYGGVSISKHNGDKEDIPTDKTD